MGQDNGGRVTPPAVAIAEPVARITVDLLPTGQITMQSTKSDPLFILGLLEMAKASIIRRATGEASLIVPGRVG